MVSLRDVAEKAGVSMSAVSFVLNNKNLHCVSKVKQERIKVAAKELAYVPNTAARNLVCKHTKMLSFVVCLDETQGFANPFYSSILEGVENGSREKGYHLIISRQDFSQLDTYTIANRIKGVGCEGLIVTGPISEDSIKKLTECDIPFIVAGNVTTARCHSIQMDIDKGYIEALTYLKKLGHTHIGFSYSEVVLAKTWIESYKALFELESFKDMRCSFISTDSKIEDIDEGYHVGKKLLAMKDRPTAMISGDLGCIGICNCFRENGYNVPEDLSVVAKLGTSVCDTYWPPLTCLDRDNFKVGHLAVKNIIDLVENKSVSDIITEKIPCAIKIGKSCASAKKI